MNQNLNDIEKKFPKLFKYMSTESNINYSKNTNKFKEQSKFVNVMRLPENFVFTNQTWYESGPDKFLYYPYNHHFGAPNQKWDDNFGGFMN
jgi:hypothetical protein